MVESSYQYVANSDEILKGIMEHITLPQIDNTHNLFHDLMSCIIEQQIHYRSSKKIFAKLLTAASLDQLSIHNFSDFEEKGLTNIKLSTRKYETILNVFTFFEQQEGKEAIDWQQKEEGEVRKILSQIKGVGTWTIDMMLLYTLERPDIFPADDYHLRLIMCDLYDIDTSARVKAQQKAIAEAWKPYRSYAVRYLLAHKASSVF